MFNTNGVLLALLILLSVSSSENSLFVFSSPVQKQSFNRIDPLSGFQPYHGGFDINNRHYWASAVFTGVHGYAVAGIWILGGLGIGIYAIVKKNHSAATNHSNSYYMIPFLLVVLCTVLAIVASSFVFAASQNSLIRARKLKHIVVRAAKQAHQTIRKITKTMHEMQHLLRPYNQVAYFQLKMASQKLQFESRNIQEVVNGRQGKMDRWINIWFGTSVGVVSINMILVVAALVSLLVHWRPGFLMIIILCWILTALCWVLTGFQFFLHTFAGDTCSAFKEYQQNPGNNSLSLVLPCVNEDYAHGVMIEIGSTVYNFIKLINSQVTEIGELLGLQEQKEDTTNENWQLCNPFTGPPNFTYIANGCPKDTIPVDKVPTMLARFTCYKENLTSSCIGKFIPEESYNMAWAYSQSVQYLVTIMPDVQNLTKCTIVKDTLSDVLSHQCTPFRVSIKMLWSAMLALSITMLVLELAWIVKAYQNKRRSFSRFGLIPIVNRENIESDIQS